MPFIDGWIRQTSDWIASPIAELLKPYSHVAAVSSMSSKDLLPRICALVDGVMITDAVGVLGQTTFRRPMQAGSVFATVEALSTPIFLPFGPQDFQR